jgi:hypothetical protein
MVLNYDQIMVIEKNLKIDYCNFFILCFQGVIWNHQKKVGIKKKNLRMYQFSTKKLGFFFWTFKKFKFKYFAIKNEKNDYHELN